MINWAYFPKNKRADDMSLFVVKAFETVVNQIDSDECQLKSNEVLAAVCPILEKKGFRVEKGKGEDEKITVPVLFGVNGKVDKAFDADAYCEAEHYVIEVEAGRAVLNYQFLKDFLEACMMSDVDYLCIALRNRYLKSPDFSKVCTFFEAIYASNRLGIPLKGMLIIGY